MELDAPSGGRTWGDVGRTLALNPSARLSPAACRQLVRAYVDLRTAVERIAEDPTSTRAQLRALVPNERQAQTKARAAEVRRRRAEHEAWAARVRANAGAGNPRPSRSLSDEEILTVPRMMALLKAIADGRAVGGEPVGGGSVGGEPVGGGVPAVGGEPVGGAVQAVGGGSVGAVPAGAVPAGVAEADVRWLADLALIDRVGPVPAVTERGRRLLWLWRR